MHFPFLTCQWKSQRAFENQFHASLQGARDGAVIVRYLFEFYTAAKQPTSVIDTAHFSLTTDTKYVSLFVHWREDDTATGKTKYHMKEIAQAFLSPVEAEDTAIVRMRKRLRNILDYALGERLTRIKKAIADMPESEVAKKRGNKRQRLSQLGSSS